MYSAFLNILFIVYTVHISHRHSCTFPGMDVMGLYLELSDMDEAQEHINGNCENFVLQLTIVLDMPESARAFRNFCFANAKADGLNAQAIYEHILLPFNFNELT